MKRVISFLLTLVLLVTSFPLIGLSVNAESTATIKNYHVTGTNTVESPTEFTFTFEVECAESVRVVTKVWTVRDGTDDMKAYTATQEETGQLTYTVKASEHKNEAGKYHIVMQALSSDNTVLDEQNADFYLNVPAMVPIYKTAFRDGKLYVRIDGRYYTYKGLFATALKLAEAPDQETLDFIKDFVSDGYKSQYVLGGVRSGNGFVWNSTGSAVADGNWAPGEPSNTNNKENVLAIYPNRGRETDLQFNDLNEDALDTGYVVCFDMSLYSPVTTGYYGGHKYEVYNHKLPWEIAKIYAEQHGGHLVTVNSAEENEYVHSFCRSANCMMGAYRNSIGSFSWVTDESFSYTNWTTGNPDNYTATNGEYFVHMSTDTNNVKKWNDINDCSSDLKSSCLSYYMVEYEPERVEIEVNEDDAHGISLDEITVNAYYPNTETPVDITLQTDIERRLEDDKIVITSKEKGTGEQLAQLKYQSKNGADDYFGVVDVRISATSSTSYDYTVVGQCPGNGKFHITNWTAHNGQDDGTLGYTRDEYSFTDTFTRTFNITATEHGNESGLYYSEVYVENTDTGEKSEVYKFHHFMNVPTTFEIGKYAVLGNKLYIRCDSDYSAFNAGFSSLFRLAEAKDEKTLNVLRRLAAAGYRNYYTIGGQQSGSNWIWQYSKTNIDLNGKWGLNQPNSSSETQISISRADGTYHDISLSTTGAGFIMEVDMDAISPAVSDYFMTNKYEVYNEPIPVEVAKLIAQLKGGHLLTVTDESENTFVKSIIGTKIYTAGGFYSEKGQLEWMTGEPFSFSNWGTNEPNFWSNTNGQYFVRIGNTWDDCNDYSTNTSKEANVSGFIVEYEPELMIKVEQDKAHGILEDEVSLIAQYPNDNGIYDFTENTSFTLDSLHNGQVLITATIEKSGGSLETVKRTVDVQGDHVLTTVSETAPTCTEGGKAEYLCERCGMVYTSYTTALGHDIRQSDIPATCTQAGYHSWKCTRCDYEKRTAYNPTGHAFSVINTVYSNATRRGYTVQKCLKCAVERRTDYVYPQVQVLPAVESGKIKQVALNTDDEFAAVSFTAQKDETVTAVAFTQSAALATGIAIKDEDYATMNTFSLADGSNKLYADSFEAEAGETYILFADKAENEVGDVVFAIFNSQQPYTIQADGLTYTFNEDFSALTVSGKGDFNRVEAIQSLLPLVKSIVIERDVLSADVGIFNSFPALQQVRVEGENTSLSGDANVFKSTALSIRSNSVAKAYADNNNVAYTLLNGYVYSFDAAGGTVENMAVYRIQQRLLTGELFASLVPKKANSLFAGWADKNDENTVYTSMPSTQADLDLVAVWNENTNIIYGGEAQTETGDFKAVDVEAGQTVSIPVRIKNNSGIMGFKITAKYDNEKLEPLSVTAGDIISGGLQDNIGGDAKPGEINIYWADNKELTQDGILFYLNFKAAENVRGSDLIQLSYSQTDTFDENLEDVVLQCNDIPIAYHHAVLDQYPELQLKKEGTAPICAGEPFALKVSIANLTLGADLNETFNILHDSRISVTGFEPAQGVSVSYENERLHFALGAAQAESMELGTLFLNSNGAYGSTNHTVVLMNNSSTISSNFFNFDILEKQSADSIILRTEVGKADDNGIFQVKVDFTDNKGIMGYRLNFTYDESLIRPVSITQGELFQSGSLSDSIGNEPGKFSVLWNNTANVYGDGTAFTVSFEKMADCQTDIAVSYDPADTFNENWADVTIENKNIAVSLLPLYSRFLADFAELNTGLPIKEGEIAILDTQNERISEQMIASAVADFTINQPSVCNIFLKPKNRTSVLLSNVSGESLIDINSYLLEAEQKNQFRLSDWALGDVSGDDVIDIQDIALLLQQQTYAQQNKTMDLNADETIDIADISVILSNRNYGKQGVTLNAADLI